MYNSANQTAEGYIAFPLAFGTSAFNVLASHAYISTAVVNDPKAFTTTALEKNRAYVKAYNLDTTRPKYSIDIFYIVAGR